MDQTAFIDAQVALHHRIRSRVCTALATHDMEHLNQIKRESEDDTIYQLDHLAEGGLEEDLKELFSPICHLHLVQEGHSAGLNSYFPGNSQTQDLPHACLILDPVDGTRGLIYGKRSAWVLSAMVLGNAPEDLTLADLTCAVQTEIPTPRSHLSDSLRAAKGQGVLGIQENLIDGTRTHFVPQPSRASSIRGGFATICRFFPPGRDRLASLDDALLEEILGPASNRAHTFEDQYLSTGGLIYQLATGRDRFVADLRGTLNDYRESAGLTRGLTCHPYDLCTWLIASEAGVVIRDPSGKNLGFPLDTTSEVSWVGFANEDIRQEVEKTLHFLIPRHLQYRTNLRD